MSDRERWIVYPLLLMALGLALQPKLVPVNLRLGEVNCEKLTCNELAAKRANVSIELDATRAKAGIVSAGAISSTLQSTNLLRVTNAEGVVHAELLSTPTGGQFDIVRFTHGSRTPMDDQDVRMFASDPLKNLIPLGVARLHWITASKESEKPKADAKPSATEPPAKKPP